MTPQAAGDGPAERQNRMSGRTRLALSGLVLAVVLAGCEDPVDPPDTLTEAEALALFKAIAVGLELLPDDDVDPGSVDTMVACPHGGRSKVVGTASARQAGDTLKLALNAVVTPAGCKVSGDGLAFTVDGDPSMSTEMSFDIIAFETVVLGGGIEGKVKWQLEDRSGECAMNLPLDATVDLSDPENPKATGGYKGKMCGHDIEFDIMVTTGEAADLRVASDG